MNNPALSVSPLLLAAALAVPSLAHAQTFKVDKYDIKGDGGTDYVTAEAATGRVFVSRSTHMMVVDGATGKVVGDIPNTPGVHGADTPGFRYCAVKRAGSTAALLLGSLL